MSDRILIYITHPEVFGAGITLTLMIWMTRFNLPAVFGDPAVLCNDVNLFFIE